MTSNERKILKCLWDKKGEAHVRAVSDACGLTSDYTRFLCRSLSRASYIKFENANVCRLLEKGRCHFEVSCVEIQEPPVVTVANVTMLSDEFLASSSEGAEDPDNRKSGDDEATGQPPMDSGELDKVLAGLDSSPKKTETEYKGSSDEERMREPEEIISEVEIAPEVDLKKESTVEDDKPLENSSGAPIVRFF